MIRHLLVVIGLILGLQHQDASAQRAVILVRHAERLDPATDSGLSKAGEERAIRLSQRLRETGIKAIYTTQFQRTRQTAEFVARVVKVQPTVIPSTEQARLIDTLRTQHANDVVLVVGHSNSIPEIMRALGVTELITIADDQFDDLFILIPIPGKPAPTVLHLHLIE